MRKVFFEFFRFLCSRRDGKLRTGLAMFSLDEQDPELEHQKYLWRILFICLPKKIQTPNGWYRKADTFALILNTQKVQNYGENDKCEIS